MTLLCPFEVINKTKEREVYSPFEFQKVVQIPVYLQMFLEKKKHFSALPDRCIQNLNGTLKLYLTFNLG